LDKDRFRQELGGVTDAYAEVAKRLGIMKDQPNLKIITNGDEE